VNFPITMQPGLGGDQVIKEISIDDLISLVRESDIPSESKERIFDAISYMNDEQRKGLAQIFFKAKAKREEIERAYREKVSQVLEDFHSELGKLVHKKKREWNVMREGFSNKRDEQDLMQLDRIIDEMEE